MKQDFVSLKETEVDSDFSLVLLSRLLFDHVLHNINLVMVDHDVRPPVVGDVQHQPGEDFPNSGVAPTCTSHISTARVWTL